MSDKADIGKRIRALREELGLSQAELSRRLGYTSRSSINKIEGGKNAIQTETVSELARVLQTTPAYLLGSLEDGLYVLGVNTSILNNGVVELHDEIRHVRVRFEPELWRKLAEADAFEDVWDLLIEQPQNSSESPRTYTDLAIRNKPKKPTPTNESEPMGPNKRALLAAIEDCDEATALSFLDAIEFVKKMRNNE